MWKKSLAHLIALFASLVLVLVGSAPHTLSLSSIWNLWNDCYLETNAVRPHGYVMCARNYPDVHRVERAYVHAIEPRLTIQTGVPADQVLMRSIKASKSTLALFIPLQVMGVNVNGVYWPYVDQNWFNPVIVNQVRAKRDMVGEFIQERMPSWYPLYNPETMNCSIRLAIWNEGPASISFDFPVGRLAQKLRFEDDQFRSTEIPLDDSNRCFFHLIAHTNTLLALAKWDA